MTCWNCEQQLRQSAVQLWRRISKSIFIAACTTTTKAGEQKSERSIKSEAELAVDDSMYCSIEANDRHEASCGYFVSKQYQHTFNE